MNTSSSISAFCTNHVTVGEVEVLAPAQTWQAKKRQVTISGKIKIKKRTIHASPSFVAGLERSPPDPLHLGGATFKTFPKASTSAACFEVCL
jgi:hypothetical protein